MQSESAVASNICSHLMQHIVSGLSVIEDGRCKSRVVEAIAFYELGIMRETEFCRTRLLCDESDILWIQIIFAIRLHVEPHDIRGIYSLTWLLGGAYVHGYFFLVGFSYSSPSAFSASGITEKYFSCRGYLARYSLATSLVRLSLVNILPLRNSGHAMMNPARSL